MSALGGVYGDFEAANNSTRVLEERKSAEMIYYNRVFSARGGNLAYFYSGVAFISGVIGFRTRLPQNFYNLAASGAISAFAFLVSPYFFGNPEELSYLRRNKEQYLSNTNRYLVEDFKYRMGIIHQ